MRRPNCVTHDSQNSRPARQIEHSRPRRARIEQQRLAEPFNFRLMRMAKDAEVWLVFLEERSSFLRQLPTFVQKMTDGDAAACQFDHGLGRKSALFIIVDVAGDSRATRRSDVTGGS